MPAYCVNEVESLFSTEFKKGEAFLCDCTFSVYMFCDYYIPSSGVYDAVGWVGGSRKVSYPYVCVN